MTEEQQRQIQSIVDWWESEVAAINAHHEKRMREIDRYAKFGFFVALLPAFILIGLAILRSAQ